MPALVLVDAHDAVAEVVVLADHVRVRVVQLVVRVLPLLGGRGVVPLPGGGVDLRVAHPVPLAVQDVVPDLHVLQDLGDRQAGGADQPGRREQRERAARARLPSSSLRWTSMTRRMYAASSLAAAGDAPRRGWRRARGRSPRCPRRSGGRSGCRTSSAWRSRSWSPSFGGGQWSMSQAPAAADTQVWMRTPSPGARW